MSDLVPCCCDPADPDGSYLDLGQIAAHSGPSVAFVCLEDDAAGLRATIRVRDELPEHFAVVVCTRGHSDVARLLRVVGSDEPLNVKGFALLDQVCRPSVLLNGDRELIAQAIHNEFLRNETLAGRREDDDAMRPWEELPEVLKESNRDQAADIGRKLDDAGLDLVLSSAWGPAKFSFSAEDMTSLSVLEHDRWMRKLIADGWKPGPVKDISRKVHPLLVPWDKLSEEDREKDRNAVRAIPSLLARSGYAIVPRRQPSRRVTAMSASELWVESYQGEVLGEALFGSMADREQDPEHRRQLQVLTLLEKATKEIAEPVFERRELDVGDTAATLATAKELADALAEISWEEFLGSIEGITVQFLAKYRELVELATDDFERGIAEAYVAHEEALACFARRALGSEPGEPLELIFALPHVVAAGA